MKFSVFNTFYLSINTLILCTCIIACDKKLSRESYITGLSIPHEELDAATSLIKSYYQKHMKWPDSKWVKVNINSPGLFHNYSVCKDGYQITIWSGETIWLYDSLTNTYHEFSAGNNLSNWYDVNNNIWVERADVASDSM